MLLHQHPGGQAFRRITRQDRHPRLAQDRPAIKLGCHLMHAAPGLGIAGLKRAGMGMQARIFRQKRGVNVQHPPLPARDEIGRQHPHEPRQTNDIRGMSGQNAA